MVVGLVPKEEQERILEKLLAYYKGIYPGVEFRKEEKELNKDEIGEIYYTYAGEQTEAAAAEKIRMINEAIGHGYATPVVLLKKKEKLILLDGHRRVRVAFQQGLSWKAVLIVPENEDIEFGIESMIMGKVKDLWGSK